MGKELERAIQAHVKQIQEQKSKIVEQRNQARQEALNSNSEYQRRRQMTHEQKVRQAIETQAKCIHERNQMFNKNASFEEAKAQAILNAQNVFRRKFK